MGARAGNSPGNLHTACRARAKRLLAENLTLRAQLLTAELRAPQWEVACQRLERRVAVLEEALRRRLRSVKDIHAVAMVLADVGIVLPPRRWSRPRKAARDVRVPR